MEDRQKRHLEQDVSRNHRLAITHILFDVLILLRAGGQSAAADAIWHSVWDAHWDGYTGEPGRSFPETVVEFSKQLRVENRQGMFQLEQSSDGTYHHKWLIDRIMLQGGFWLGRLVKSSSDQEYTEWRLTYPEQPGSREHSYASAEEPVSSTLQDVQQQQTSHARIQEAALPSKKETGMVADPMASIIDDTMKPFDQRPTPESAEGPLVTDRSHSRPKRTMARGYPRKPDRRIAQWSDKGLIHNQLIFSSFLKLAEWAKMKTPTVDNDDVDDFNGLITPESIVAFTAALKHMDGRKSDSSLRQKRGIFDIDGDASGRVLVLTPFQQHMETIPRPETQSMCVSWVVQSISQPIESYNTDSGESEEVLETTGMVRGMWELMVQPSFTYKLV